MSLALVLALTAVGAPSPCASHPSAVVVVTGARRMWLCDASGRSHADYRVSLGRNGVGKTQQGDEKTPLGVYPLGEPRRSYSGFHNFIPVGYPTTAQKERGFTGSAIGIHGPMEGWPEVPSAMQIGDWTYGCIAVWTARAINEVSDWVEREGIETIVVLMQSPPI